MYVCIHAVSACGVCVCVCVMQHFEIVPQELFSL